MFVEIFMITSSLGNYYCAPEYGLRGHVTLWYSDNLKTIIQSPGNWREGGFNQSSYWIREIWTRLAIVLLPTYILVLPYFPSQPFTGVSFPLF